MDRARAGRTAREYFETTSFLDGTNAVYIEQLHDLYNSHPISVDSDWRDFFASLEENIEISKRSAKGPSWKLPNWPIPVNGELTSALDGNWPPNAKPAAERSTPASYS